MSRCGVVCEVSDVIKTDEQCLQCALTWGDQPDKDQVDDDGKPIWHHCRFNFPMMRALLAPQAEREHAGISATMLTGCIRQGIWKQQKEYAIYPGQMWAALDGTFVHGALEAYNEPDILAEVRLVKCMPSGITLTGKMDRYLPQFKRLEDYKTKDGGKLFTVAPADYVAQLNIYRYMLETGCIVQETGEMVRYPVEALWLYPLSHKTVGKPVVCPIWSLEQTENYIEERLAVYRDAESAADGVGSSYLPPRRFREPQRETFCREYCPFVDRCAQVGGELEHECFRW